MVLLDDVRGGNLADPPLADSRSVWHEPNVGSVGEAAALAADASLQLVSCDNLSAPQRLRRSRDHISHVAQPLLRFSRGRPM